MYEVPLPFKYISSLWDTGANSEVRKSIYSRADAVMICFPVNHDTESIDEVLREFVEESRNVSKKIFLVGTKKELLEKWGKQMIVLFKLLKNNNRALS